MEPKHFILAPEHSLELELFACPNCSVCFGQERTVAGPRFCPACGSIFGMDLPCTVVDLLKLIKLIDEIAPEVNTVDAKMPNDGTGFPLWVWISMARKFLRGA
jgi:hypothetical protein